MFDVEPVPSVEQARDRLLAARGSVLDELCERHDVAVLTLFGSAARGEDAPQDLDLGVLYLRRPASLLDVGGLLADLVGLLGVEAVDVMDVERASVTGRARALGHGAIPLYEDAPGRFAREQMAALDLEMDTAPLREEQLRLLAGR